MVHPLLPRPLARAVPYSLSVLTWLCGLAGCQTTDPVDPLAGLTVVGEDPTDVPLANATPADHARFVQGDQFFEHHFGASEGLGPLYIRDACASCHQSAMPGPGAVQKMAQVQGDGVTPVPGQPALPFGHTVRPYLTGVATTAIAPPAGSDIKLSLRLGPAVFGRGYLEAIGDEEIERIAAEQAKRTDAIHGVVHRVTYASEANPGTQVHHHTPGQTGIIGRFGYKARIATLDEFAADAFQGDMGVTSPMRPVELANPDSQTDDLLQGVDVSLEVVNAIADYMRLLAIPPRATPDTRGQTVFAEIGCAVCHVPSLKTRADYPLPQLAGVDAPLYTDVLLHDMGTQLADGLTDADAGPRQWKTAPLVGLRHATAYLHDGRAKTLEQAVLAHGGDGSEAKAVTDAFVALSSTDRAALLTFLRSL